jgi:CO/xanthine dehydrogenase Mo-binding subunit
VGSTPNSTPTWCCASRRAHDCGQIINPDGIRNQIEGNVIQTLSRTLLSFDVQTDQRSGKSAAANLQAV